MIETIHWHTVHPRYLNSDSRVLDLGANYGRFTRAITERFGCYCVAVEPSPNAFAGINTGPRIVKLQKAVADKCGTCEFHVAKESTTSSLDHKAGSFTGTISVPVVSLAALLDELKWDYVDLIKIDVEGAEIRLLEACPDDVLQQIGQISIEFHDFCGITPAQDVKGTLSRLNRLGFREVRMSRVGHQDTWIINQRLLGIPTIEIWFSRWIIRNWFGVQRVLKRLFGRIKSKFPESLRGAKSTTLF